MDKARAKRIMRLMGWGPTETARQYNRVAGTNLRRQDIASQVGASSRGVADGLAVFLKMSVKLACAQRRLKPEACAARLDARRKAPER